MTKYDTKKSKPKQRRYVFTPQTLRTQLINRFLKGIPVRRAAKELGVHYSISKKIVQDFKRGKNHTPKG